AEHELIESESHNGNLEPINTVLGKTIFSEMFIGGVIDAVVIQVNKQIKIPLHRIMHICSQLADGNGKGKESELEFSGLVYIYSA
ncbi:hypothetical protein, partial [Saccharophagus degradans]